MKANLPRRDLSHPVPGASRDRKPVRPFPAVSQHVPVTPQNRTYLRALREAEMQAWTASAGAGFDTGQFERKRVVEKERRDLRVFGVIALMALATVTIGFMKSSAFTEQLAGLLNLVQQWLN